MPELNTTEIVDLFCSAHVAAAATAAGANGSPLPFIRHRQEELMAHDYDRIAAFLIVAAFENAAFKVRRNSLPRLSRIFENLREDEIELAYDLAKGARLSVRQTCMTDQPFRDALRNQFKCEMETLAAMQPSPVKPRNTAGMHPA